MPIASKIKRSHAEINKSRDDLVHLEVDGRLLGLDVMALDNVLVTIPIYRKFIEFESRYYLRFFFVCTKMIYRQEPIVTESTKDIVFVFML